MSNPWWIIYRDPDSKTYTSIRINYGAESAAALLNTEYTNEHKVAETVKLGDASFLEDSIERPEGHSWKDPVPGYSVFYHRDRNEDWKLVQPKVHRSLTEALKRTTSSEPTFIMVDGTWFVRVGNAVVDMADVKHINAFAFDNM